MGIHGFGRNVDMDVQPGAVRVRTALSQGQVRECACGFGSGVWFLDLSELHYGEEENM